MCARRITLDGIRAALDYGRAVYTRGAVIYVLGRKEVKQCRRNHLDISRWNGLQVVCSGGGTILTAYRNEVSEASGRAETYVSERTLGVVERRDSRVFHDTFPQPISR